MFFVPPSDPCPLMSFVSYPAGYLPPFVSSSGCVLFPLSTFFSSFFSLQNTPFLPCAFFFLQPVPPCSQQVGPHLSLFSLFFFLSRFFFAHSLLFSLGAAFSVFLFPSKRRSFWVLRLQHRPHTPSHDLFVFRRSFPFSFSVSHIPVWFALGPSKTFSPFSCLFVFPNPVYFHDRVVPYFVFAFFSFPIKTARIPFFKLSPGERYKQSTASLGAVLFSPLSDY